MKLNINEKLFNEVKNELFDLPTDPFFKKVSENFQNENLQYFGICFCQKRLLDAYNCTFKEYKTPKSVIFDCFFAGVLAIKLYKINNSDDAVCDIRNILTEQTISVYDFLKGWFVGEVEDFENLYDFIEKSISKMEKYTNLVSERSCLQDNLSVMFAFFLFGTALSIQMNSDSEIIQKSKTLKMRFELLKFKLGFYVFSVLNNFSIKKKKVQKP